MRQVPVLLLLGSLAVLAARAQSSSSLQFLTVAPCRIMDTRNPNGPLGGPFVTGETTRTIPIPSGACGVPATASAYSLNFTVVPRAGELAYLSVWPTGQPQPLVSTLNSLDGSVIANAAIVRAGTAGAINAYATNDTDLVVDINGYFAPPAANTLQFYTLPPCRVLDTRNANGTFGGPSIAGGTARSFPIPSSSCGVPASVAAYAFNVTVVPQGPLGYLTAWPTGQAQPLVSTLNSFDGTTLANAAIVPAGTGGAVNFYASNATDLVVDINGYFAPPGTGGLNFYALTPCRVVDTRNPNGTFGGPTMAAGTTRAFPLSQGSCGLPSVLGAQGYSLNVTVVPRGALSYLSTWPAGGTQPVVSTLNAFEGQVVANAAIVPAGGTGSIEVYVTNTTDMVIDTNGYFGNASVSPQNPVLSILTAGTGSGTVGSSPQGTSCGSGCLSFPAGTAVILTATPNTGSTFAGWSGACSGTGSCSVSMNSSQAITATFISSALVQTSQSGNVLYLQSSSGGVTARIGLNTTWGGSIVEASVNGVNYVNNHDTGREVQPALYDGSQRYDSCAGCTSVWGWDPVLAGDRYSNGSPVLAQTVTPSSFYVKTQPLEWYPDNKGGGPTTPVLSDMYFEQTITAANAAQPVFHIQYTLTHIGTDTHYNAVQEIPGVYTNPAYSTLAYYGGTSPWLGGTITKVNLPGPPGPNALYSSEYWAAFLDANDTGVAVFTPGLFPYLSGFSVATSTTAIGDNYFRPFAALTIGPGTVIEGDYYVVPGEYTAARTLIYALHQQFAPAGDSAPWGNTDTPQANATLSGVVTVAGWALDNVAVSQVEVLVDGVLAGRAIYGNSRPDIPAAYPNASPNTGYSFPLDTTKLSNGQHTIVVSVSDTSNNVALFPPVTVTVKN